MHLMIFGPSFKSGGLIRSRSKGLNLWVVLLGMDFITWMWLGHLIGDSKCPYVHLMNLMST